MKESALARKLGVQPHHRVLVLNAPASYLEEWDLTDTNAGSKDANSRFDIVHLFAVDQAALKGTIQRAQDTVAPGGRLWISFPKGSSKLQTDLTRDLGWDLITDASPRFMTLISVNDIWSAARLNPSTLKARY